MRTLLFGFALWMAAPTFAVADVVADGAASSQTAACAPGWVTAACGNYTGCAQQTWSCCPVVSSDDGWQWSESGCSSGP